MKNVQEIKKLALVAGICIVGVVTSSWQRKEDPRQDSARQHNEYKQEYKDTSQPNIRGGRDSFQMQDFDAAVKDLDKAMQEVTVQMKQLDLQKINLEVNAAIKNINFEEINKQVELAMKQVDFDKINKEVQASLDNIDMAKIKEQVNESLVKAKAEVAKVNTEKMAEEMKALKEKLNSDEFKAKIDGKKIQEQVDKAMKEARGSIEKAKKELQNYKDFTNELEKDGLIDKSKGYTLELKDGYLYIDGKQQSKETTEKYRKYYMGKDHFKLNMNGNDHDSKGESL